MATATAKKKPASKKAYKGKATPGQAKYDWVKWLDGGKHVAKQGKDFHCTAKAFTCAVYMAAKRKGKTVELKISEDKTTVAFVAKPAKKAPKKKPAKK